LLSHRGLLAAAAKSQQSWNLTPGDVQLGVLPLFHLAGIGFTLALQVAGGSTIVLPRFDPKALVGLIDGQGGSVMGSFPPMLGALLDAAAEAGSKLANLRVVTGIDTPETLARFAAACPHADFWVAYGQTETSGSVAMARFSERPGSAGRPVAQHVLAIVDELDRPLPQGQTGEIVVRGPMVFRGYWRCDEDNAFTLRNGWHHTGDMGRFDADGYLWYSGRSPAKELIKPGGENVYPAEVERALLEHPALAEAVVFGVPDAQWGEAVKAICVLKPGQVLAADALIEFVGQRIARYKKPKHVVFVAALPRSPTGGIDRAAVKAAHAQV
jgi:acyl-CoA synthetase (AMP-forming)/AMP-acid ligase II